MDLPDNFSFSQRSLQDFDYCKRLFRYRYVEKIKWPAVELDPIDELEKRAKLGAEFHRVVHQFYSGIPEQKIENSLGDPTLKKWWNNFKNSMIKNSDESDAYLAEVRLYSIVRNMRLTAKIDLIAVKPDGSRIIYDWKTSRKRPQRKALNGHFQTMVYPFVLISARDRIFPWKNFTPDQVKMIYWFAEFPEDIEVFSFDQHNLDRAREVISNVIEKIDRMRPGEFSKTNQEIKCNYCVYRSLCERGYLPGNDEDASEWILPEETREFDFDFDQITEIEY